MEKLIICVIVYASLVAVGLRSIRRNGRKREMIWYSGLVGWCIYMSMAALLHWPSGSISELHLWLFTPVGKWLKQMLG